MAIERLDEQYRDRLDDPLSYIRISSIVEEDTARYGAVLPGKVGYGVLMFGYFTSRERVVCQPWMLGADIQGCTWSQHQQVSIDIQEEHSSNFNLGYEYNPEGQWQSVTRDVWPCYVWKGGSMLGSAAVLAVAHQYPHSDDNYRSKLDAVIAETEVGGALKDHEIHIPQGIIWEGSLFSNEKVYAD